MKSELLARVSCERREFLTRTAVLDRMCGPLCESVLDLPGVLGGPGRYDLMPLGQGRVAAHPGLTRAGRIPDRLP